MEKTIPKDNDLKAGGALTNAKKNVLLAGLAFLASTACWLAFALQNEDKVEILTHSAAYFGLCALVNQVVVKSSKSLRYPYVTAHYAGKVVEHLVLISSFAISPYLCWSTFPRVVFGTYMWTWVAMILRSQDYPTKFWQFYWKHHAAVYVFLGLLMHYGRPDHLLLPGFIFTAADLPENTFRLFQGYKQDPMTPLDKTLMSVTVLVKHGLRQIVYVLLACAATSNDSNFKPIQYAFILAVVCFDINGFLSVGFNAISELTTKVSKQGLWVPFGRNPITSSANWCLSINRLCRGCVTPLFGLHALTLLHGKVPSWVCFIWSFTSTMWYNGLNDVLDYEVDYKAYIGKPKGLRKVLVCGAIQHWEVLLLLAVSLVASCVLIYQWSDSPLLPGIFFFSNLLGSVLYNFNSKHMADESLLKYLFYDFVIGCPNAFFTLFLIAMGKNEKDVLGFQVLKTISAITNHMYFNYMLASKDLQTDPKSFPLYLGVRYRDGKVVHSSNSRVYVAFQFTMSAVVWTFGAFSGHFVPSIMSLAWLSHASWHVIFGEAKSPKWHAKRAIGFANIMLFSNLCYLKSLAPDAFVLGCGLSVLEILASVLYLDQPDGKLVINFEKLKRWLDPSKSSAKSVLAGWECRIIQWGKQTT